jgi:hypothetical protein
LGVRRSYNGRRIAAATTLPNSPGLGLRVGSSPTSVCRHWKRYHERHQEGITMSVEQATEFDSTGCNSSPKTVMCTSRSVTWAMLPIGRRPHYASRGRF